MVLDYKMKDKYKRLGELIEISDTEFFILTDNSGIHIKDHSLQPIRVIGREPLSIETGEDNFSASSPDILYNAAKRMLCDSFCGQGGRCYGNFQNCPLR